MILDSSAVLALAFVEAEHETFVDKIDTAPLVGIGAPSVVESAVVLSRRAGTQAPTRLREILEGSGIVVVAFDVRHWQVAVEAWMRFGKGRHEARLNFGDCLAYAVARVADRPLLTKDPGFAKTDLALA